MPIKAVRLFESEASPRRKRPQQARAQETVERIKQAMLDLIAEEGYAAASTNQIAKRAKVNIASLYQYFPNRQAIALALYEGSSAELAQRVHKSLLANMALSLEQGVAGVVKTVIDFLEQEQVILMHLAEEVVELRETAQAMSLENLSRYTSRAYLEHHLGKLDETTLTCKLYFVQSLGMGMIRRYLLDRPQGISKSRFVVELADLLVGYLRSTSSTAVQDTLPINRQKKLKVS